MKDSEAAQTMTRTGERGYVMSRVFDAPRELVWRAYTDPAAIPHWWGPRYLATTVEKMDVRTGGEWRYTQRDGEGNVYRFFGEYREVTPPERLVYTFEFEPMAGHIVVDEVDLEDLGAKTQVTVTSTFATPEDLQGMIDSGMEAGAAESWDRLAEYLAAQAGQEGEHS